MPDKKLYLVDGTSLCYRSYFAIRLNNSSGLPTGAVYGFYKTFKKIILKEKPDFVGVCFDVSRKTHRQEKFKDYKIQRPPLPEGLEMQFPFIKKLIRALGVKIIEKTGYEADDLIASLTKAAGKKGLKVVVVSSDKDLYQLLSEKGVSVYNYRKEMFYRREDFIQEYGFEPACMADYLSLAGDASDNIPGAKGIGKVGAAALIKEFKNIDNIFKNLNRIKPKIADKLKASRKEIILSKELAVLSEPSLDIEIEQLKRLNTDKEELTKIFSELEFKLSKEDFFDESVIGLESCRSYPSSQEEACGKVKKGLSFNSLTSKGQFTYCIDSGKAYIYFPVDGCTYEEEIDKAQGILKDASGEKITFDLKQQALDYPKINIQGEKFDIQIAAYLADSSLSDYDLVSLVAVFLGEHYSDIKKESYPFFIWRLYKVLKDRLKQENLEELFYEIEMPLVGVLSKMQANGINIDTSRLKEALRKVNKRIDSTIKKVFKNAHKEFNLNSPKQLQEVLFDDLGIKPVKKTKTGYSTNEEVLKELAREHKIAEYILQYRELSKLKNTYLEPLGRKVKESGGRLFAHFNQTGTQTGRLSSSSPNLQSIPVKGEFSFDLRKSFISSYKNGYIVCGDYSQIELRILAHLSEDKNLVDAFKKNLDIHRFTASLLFDSSQEQIDSLQRDSAKKVNFGIVYGMSPYGLSKEMGIGLKQAQEFIDNYFSRYPGVKEYIEKTIKRAEEKGYVETIFKRRRVLPQIYSPNSYIQEFAKRQAVNAPIQGSCADIIKLAMVRIDKKISQKNIQAKLIMQIHDELVFDADKKCLEELMFVIKDEMENSVDLAVPLKVNMKAGKSWAEVEDWKDN